MEQMENRNEKPYLKKEIGVSQDSKQKKVWKCDPCGKSYILIGNFQKHNSLEHPNGTFNENQICDICGKSFKKKATLRAHLTCVHIDKRMLKCEFCNKGFNSKSSLKSHVESVHESVKYKCQTCDKNYSKI